MAKSDRYNWALPGDKGRHARIAVADLKVDHSYQRPEVSDGNTIAIARAFSWVAFGVIVVMQRANGDYYIVDGQQRWLAALRREDIRDVPCIVFQSEGRDHEAKAFLSLNVRRINVRAVVKFLASVKAKLNPETEISEWLATQGLAIASSGRDVDGIDFPTLLLRTYKIDAQSAKNAVIIQRAINGTEPLHGRCHQGLFWLIHGGIKVNDYVPKIRGLGGRSAMLRAIQAVAIETNAAASPRVCGVGILRLINHKLRTKIATPGND